MFSQENAEMLLNNYETENDEVLEIKHSVGLEVSENFQESF